MNNLIGMGNGRLRVGVPLAPAITPLFVTTDPAGKPRGVSVDIGLALARACGVEADFVVAGTTGELTDAVEAGRLDVAFMPADDERRRRVDFSPPYFVIESTYLVGPNVDIDSMAQVNQPGVAVVGIAGSTTFRAAQRTAPLANFSSAPTIAQAMDMLASGAVAAFALTHDALPALQKNLPGSRILAGAFQVTGVALALQKNQATALAFASAFIETAKKDGTVRRALDNAGLGHLAIAD